MFPSSISSGKTITDISEEDYAVLLAVTMIASASRFQSLYANHMDALVISYEYPCNAYTVQRQRT